MRTISIFLSSSLKHPDERQAFLRGFKAEETDDLRFNLYIHEENGVMAITVGSDSQVAINAAALGCDAFILFAGDKIGAATIEEFNHEVSSARSLFKFLYVVHQPGILPDSADSSRYADYFDGFERPYLEGTPLKQYATNLRPVPEGMTDPEERKKFVLDNIEEKARAIARELRGKTIAELYPPMLEYRKVISDGQTEYRDATSFYYRRQIDDDLAVALAGDAGVPLVLVSGTSLAGKTRAVTEAIRQIDEPGVHVHLMQYHAGSAAALLDLNPELQFRREFRNIFFIDEVDRITRNPEVTHKFIEICRLAARDPRRLTVVATSILPGEAFRERLLDEGSADRWTRQSRYLTIPPLSTKDIRLLVGRLRRAGIIGQTNGLKIANGMPLGAIFIDLDKMRNLYETALREYSWMARLSDAVKTLWIWKVESRGDIWQLIDFYNNAYPAPPRPKHLKNAPAAAEPIDADRLWEMFHLIAEFVTVEGDGDDFSFSIEDILVDEVFRFSKGNDEFKAIRRIVDYIRDNLSNPFENYTKLLTRLATRGRQNLAATAAGYILELFPIDRIVSEGLREEEQTFGDVPLDWVANFLGAIATVKAETGAFDEVRDLWERTRLDQVLEPLLKMARQRGDISETLRYLRNRDSLLEQHFAATANYRLINEIATALPFSQALQIIGSIDFRRVADCNSVTDDSKSDEENQFYIARRHKTFAGWTIRQLVSRVQTTGEFDRVISLADEMNRKYSNALFGSKAELYFDIIGKGTWKTIAGRLPSSALLALFRELRSSDRDAGSEFDRENYMIQKSACLNALMNKMEEVDARVAWDELGPLQDSFSLRSIVDKSCDFPQAKGIIDTFLESEQGKDTVLNREVLNTLLGRCSTEKDRLECTEIYRRYGKIRPGEDLFSIPDPYLQGTIVNLDFVSFHTKTEILRRHRPADPESVRPQPTYVPIVKFVDGFDSTRDLIFSDTCPSFLTPAEQRELRYNPIAISNLFDKARTPDERISALSLLDRLFEQEDPGEPLLSNVENHIVTKIIQNRTIFPTITEVQQFVGRLTSTFPTFSLEGFPEFALMERIVDEPELANRPETVEMINRLVIRNAGGSLERARRAVKIRIMACGNNSPSGWVRDESKSDFPLFNDDGELTVMTTTPRRFARNMLDHALLHPYHLENLLTDALENSDNPAQAIRDIVDKAFRTKTYIDHKRFIKLRKSFDKQGLRNTNIYLIAKNYSIIKDIALRLHADEITVAEAEEEIDVYEKMNRIRVHRTNRFWDAVIKRMTNDRNESVDSILRFIDSLPDYRLDNERRYFLLHAVRSLSDYGTLSHLFGNMTSMELQALMKAMGKCEPKVRHQIMERVMPVLDSKADDSAAVGDDVLMGLLRYRRGASVDSSLEYFALHGRGLSDSTAFGNLLEQIASTTDYDKAVASYTGGNLEPKHLKMIFRSMIIYPDFVVNGLLFEKFNNRRYIDLWRPVAEKDSKGLVRETYDKFIKTIKHREKAYGQPRDYQTRRFIAFWRQILK
ncbi:MAG: hypothetical protein NC336_04740 [Clostridium sp.]|nr:hypothetical protein [Clostridium sp.]